MALRLVSSEWVEEIERDKNCAEQTLRNMTKAHDRAVQSYRELRDMKDEEIRNLHLEIEALKKDKADLSKKCGQLRQAVAYYEALKDGKTAV